MSTACLLVPSLALACELARRASLIGEPVAIAAEASAAVAECSPEAMARGVRPGMPVRTATALCPTLSVFVARPARTARAAELLLEALGSVSPLIEEAAPGQVYADLVGLQGLYPTPESLEQAVLEAAPRALRPRLGVASTRFTSYVAARCADPGDALRIEAHEAAAFLAGQPAAWLPLDIEAVERLRLFGIETMGEFARLPRHAVLAQFGYAGELAWHAANGADPTPVRPGPYAQERVREHSQHQPPLVSREAVARTVEQQLIRALRHRRVGHRFVRWVHVRATTDSDQLWERTQVLREPVGDRERLWTVVRTVLDGAVYPGPVAELDLELGGLTEESGQQRSLFDSDRTRRREQLDEMVRHLKVRYGQSPVARVVEVEPWSRIPERRYALLDYDP